MPRFNWNTKEPNLPPIANYRLGEGLTPEAQTTWPVITGLVRPSADQPGNKRQQLNDLFGAGNWQQGWLFRDQILDRPEALALYEEAYFIFFQEHQEELDWLCVTACEVWDHHLSNIESGLDYAIQETKAAHLQDISIRRVVIRLGRRLAGDQELEVHDEGSAGFQLNPGQVPFHQPGEILADPVRDWWLPFSIEAFWQHNKVILVKPEVLPQTPAQVDSGGSASYYLSDQWVLRQDSAHSRVLTAINQNE